MLVVGEADDYHFIIAALFTVDPKCAPSDFADLASAATAAAAIGMVQQVFAGLWRGFGD